MRYEGCRCLNDNLKCCGDCKCGTKKAACKNKAEEGQAIANPSAFARHTVGELWKSPKMK